MGAVPPSNIDTIGAVVNDIGGVLGTTPSSLNTTTIPSLLNGSTPGGTPNAQAESNPTIIIENTGSNMLTYVLIGLGVLGLVALVVMTRRGRGGGGGKHKGKK